jgi:RHS repeat-associated protein
MVSIGKSGTLTVAHSYGATANTGFGGATFTAFDPVVPVAAGDYFTVAVYQNSGDAVSVPVEFSIVALGGPSVGGAHVLKTATLSESVNTPNGWSSDLPFTGTVFDTGGFWSSGSPARVTVPAGVGYVQVSAWLWQYSQCTLCLIRIVKNGSSVVAESYAATANTGFGGAKFNAWAPVIPVVAGDYFTVRVYQNTGAAVSSAVEVSIAALDGASVANGVTFKTAALDEVVSVPNGWSPHRTFSSTAFDTVGFWTSGSPARLTIPSGVTHVQLAASIELGPACTVCQVYIVKNDAISVARSYGATANTGVSQNTFSAVSSTIAVSPGDFFAVDVYQNTGTTVSARVRFSIVDVTAPTNSMAPSISSLSPASGIVGQAVAINGSNFGATQGSSTVTFNGVTATVANWSASAITAIAPAGIMTGPVVVTVDGQASNGSTFTVIPPPHISSLTPSAGPVGTTVEILGSDFFTGNGTVTFNGVSASILSWSPTSITVTVPATATTGPVVVIKTGQSSNSLTFTVSSSPVISSLSPASGSGGQSVTINGANFGATQGSSTVTFNGVLATVTSWSDSSIVATVPLTASTGPVVVTVNGATSNAPSFIVNTFGSGAGCSGYSVVYGQNWGKGVAPIAMKSNGDHYQNTQWGGTDAVDPLYPEIAASETVTVINGAGPSGENVLDRNPAEPDYVISGLVIGGFGTSSSGWWDASRGCLSVSYKFTSAAWDQAIYNPLVTVAEDLYYHFSFGVGFSLEADVRSPGQAALILGYNTPDSWETIDTYQLTRATTENQWQMFDVRWQAGTVDTSGNVSADGWLRVYLNGTLIYNVTNVPLRLGEPEGNPGGQPNLMRAVWLGYYGLFGPTTNLIVADCNVSCIEENNDDNLSSLPAGNGLDPGGSVSYYHLDAIRSVRMITGPSQNEIARYDFLPFGEEPAAGPPSTLKFTGQERDTETQFGAWNSLDYFGARYYQSQTGRFSSVDPGHIGGDLFDPQSWNGYAYARNNPLRFIDPTGTDYFVSVIGGQGFWAMDLGWLSDGGFHFINGGIFNSSGVRVGTYKYLDPVAMFALHTGLLANDGLKTGAEIMAKNALAAATGGLLRAALSGGLVAESVLGLNATVTATSASDIVFTVGAARAELAGAGIDWNVFKTGVTALIRIKLPGALRVGETIVGHVEVGGRVVRVTAGVNSLGQIVVGGIRIIK